MECFQPVPEFLMSHIFFGVIAGTVFAAVAAKIDSQEVPDGRV